MLVRIAEIFGYQNEPSHPIAAVQVNCITSKTSTFVKSSGHRLHAEVLELLGGRSSFWYSNISAIQMRWGHQVFG